MNSELPKIFPTIENLGLRRRLGKFSISIELLHTGNHFVLLQLFSNVIIVKAEQHFDTNIIEYLGISIDFEEVAEGAAAPYYTYVYEQNKGGHWKHV